MLSPRAFVAIVLFQLAPLARAYRIEDEAISVKFVNNADRSGALFFVPKNVFNREEQEEPYVGTIGPNRGAFSQDTYVTHRFKFVIEGLEPYVVKAMSSGTIEFDVRDGKLMHGGDATKYKERADVYKGNVEFEKLTEKLRKQCIERHAGGSSKDADYFCNKQHDRRTFITAKFDHSDGFAANRMREKQVERKRKTRDQPTRYHNFTDVGFRVSEIPQGLYRKLKDFHKSHRLKSWPENLPWDDESLAGRESDTWLADLPEDLKSETSKMLRRAISSWSGVPEDELERTAFFGVRLYHKGSVLNMHVDRKETHVLSAILEVGRADAADTAQWPLKIVDHAGETHMVPSQQGQLILYESATCPHGRDTPFGGREVANCFAHFAPKGWPKKYKVQRPEL